jgi:hypothetical protein
MLGHNKLDDYRTGFQQFDNVAKQATIMGTGKTGKSGKLYIAQLWIGHQSVFTVEGELIGNQEDDADQMFAAILKSIRHQSWKSPAEAAAAADKTPAPALTAAKPASPAVQQPAAQASDAAPAPTATPDAQPSAAPAK